MSELPTIKAAKGTEHSRLARKWAQSEMRGVQKSIAFHGVGGLSRELPEDKVFLMLAEALSLELDAYVRELRAGAAG